VVLNLALDRHGEQHALRSEIDLVLADIEARKDILIGVDRRVVDVCPAIAREIRVERNAEPAVFEQVNRIAEEFLNRIAEREQR